MISCGRLYLRDQDHTVIHASSSIIFQSFINTSWHFQMWRRCLHFLSTLQVVKQQNDHRWCPYSSCEIMTIENMCNKSSSIPYQKKWVSVRHRNSSSAESNIVLLTFRIFHRSITWPHDDWWDVTTFLWNRVTSAIENVHIIFIFFSMPSLSKNNLLRRSSFDASQVVRQLFFWEITFFIYNDRTIEYLGYIVIQTLVPNVIIHYRTNTSSFQSFQHNWDSWENSFCVRPRFFRFFIASHDIDQNSFPEREVTY